MKPFWTSETYSKAQLKSDNVQALDTKWDEVWSAITDKLTARWRILYKMQVEKSERIEILVASLRSKDNIWRHEVWLLKSAVDGPKTSREETQRFSLQSEKSRRGQTCNWSSEQRETKGKSQINCNKNNSERVDCTRWTTKGQRSFGDAFRVQAGPEQEMQREEKTLVHFLQQFHRTETRKVREKVAMTEVRRAHQNSLVKVRQDKRTDDFVQTSRKEVVKRETIVITGVFTSVQEFQAPSGCKLGDKRTWKHNKTCCWEENSASIAIHIPSKYRCNYIECSRMTISRTSTFWKEKIWDLHNGVIQTGSKKTALYFTQERVKSSRFVFRESKQVLQTKSREQCLFTFCNYVEKREKERERGITLWTRELHIIWWVKVMLTPVGQKRNKIRRIHQLSLQMKLIIRLKKQQFMSEIWTCLFKSIVERIKNHPHTRWVNCENKTVSRRKWHPRQQSYHI